MPALEFRFPAGRYHATPWGRHVNEGMVEWPPSPWRLLRSLLAVGYAGGVWDASGPPPSARVLFEKLASVLPAYQLPPVVGAAHTQHYMPLYELKEKTGEPNRTMVFDAWAKVAKSGRLTAEWDVDLSGEERALLSDLAFRLNYLGRSESWVAARLLPSGARPAGPAEEDSRFFSPCLPSDEPPPPGWEEISLLAPMGSAAYAEWRERHIARAAAELAAGHPEKKKPAKKQLEKVAAPYPPDLIACLQQQTSDLKKYGWSRPPGSQAVFYRRRIGALESGSPLPERGRPSGEKISCILLSLTTRTGNSHALPSVARTLPQGELLHRALVSRSDPDKTGGGSPALTGKDASGRRLKGAHCHAHILHLDLDDDGHLDHVLIWTPGGLDHKDRTAVMAVRRTYAKGVPDPLRLALAGEGETRDLRRLPGKWGRRLTSVLGPAEGARKWESHTPFVPPRHMKRSGKNRREMQIAVELASRGFPDPVEIRFLPPGRDAESLRMRHFIRRRGKGPPPPVDVCFRVELEFAQPVSGPVCLGYGSHFGLGLFRVAD